MCIYTYRDIFLWTLSLSTNLKSLQHGGLFISILNHQKHPMNFILLGLFTLSVSMGGAMYIVQRVQMNPWASHFIYTSLITRATRVWWDFFFSKKKKCFYFENLIYKFFFFFWKMNLIYKLIKQFEKLQESSPIF